MPVVEDIGLLATLVLAGGIFIGVLIFVYRTGYKTGYRRAMMER